jgi:hypothetical protein
VTRSAVERDVLRLPCRGYSYDPPVAADRSALVNAFDHRAERSPAEAAALRVEGKLEVGRVRHPFGESRREAVRRHDIEADAGNERDAG